MNMEGKLLGTKVGTKSLGNNFILVNCNLARAIEIGVNLKNERGNITKESI